MKTPLKIGINGRFLVAKRTGVQRAAYNLVRALLSLDRLNEYVLFTGNEEVGKSDWDYPNVKVVGANLRSSESLRNHIWEQFELPRLARAEKIDILHSPANIAPLFYRGKSIVHIHDLCFVVNPQWYSFSFRTVYNYLIPKIAKRATRVITNSNNSKNDLLQFFGISAEKISLVYWAVDDSFLPKTSQNNQQARSEEKEDYILYVGSLEPRKNISLLLDAYEILRGSIPGIKTKLVLIGGESPLFASARIKVKNFAEDIVFKGFVTDQELRDYYRKAKVVAYPSLYEGFGLPPLEAMASGTPVVSTRTSSIPEVVGDAAILVSPHDADELASALRSVLTDQQLSSQLIQNGYRQVKAFTWSRVAKSVLGIYEQLAKSDQGLGFSSFEPISFLEWKRIKELGGEYLPGEVG